MNFRFAIFALMLAVWVLGCPGTGKVQTAAPRNLTIIYSGNALAELKPCGCAREEDQGGIERRMGYLKSVTTANTLLVDLGDNFKESTRQGKLKSSTLMTAMERMQYDAVTFGDLDLLYGNTFLANHKNIPWVSTNMQLAGLDIPRYRIKIFADGLKAAVLAVSDPALFYGDRHGNLKMEPPAEAIQAVLPDLLATEKPDIVILLTHMQRQQGLALLDIEGIDVVINGHIGHENDEIDMQPVTRGNRIFVQPGPRGQKMGELQATVDSNGTKTFHQQMIKLDSKVPFDEGMTQLYEDYNAEVEKIFFATFAAKRKKNKEAVYATGAVCQTCHADIHDSWSQSRHGNAYATLKKVNKSFDPECLVCHTTGFNQPGGFISELDTPDLKNVQCEVCHGPQREHAQAPQGGFARQAREACKTCHVKNHSPGFDFTKYWAKIRH